MLKNPAYCGERSLRETGGLVASLLNVAHWLRFRCSLLGRPSRFGLTRLATAGFFSSLLVVVQVVDSNPLGLEVGDHLVQVVDW